MSWFVPFFDYSLLLLLDEKKKRENRDSKKKKKSTIHENQCQKFFSLSYNLFNTVTQYTYYSNLQRKQIKLKDSSEIRR